MSQVFGDLGLTRQEIDNYLSGPAYLAWFRMGNLKKFGGKLTDNWHLDQVQLQKLILKRYNELGIKYALPVNTNFIVISKKKINLQIKFISFFVKAFAGFVPDQMQRLFPNTNFTISSDWVGFNCNYSW